MRNNDGPESHDAPPHPIHEEAIHLGGEERDATRRHNPTAYPGRAGDPRYTTRPKTALKISHAHDFLRGATLPSVHHAYIPYVVMSPATSYYIPTFPQHILRIDRRNDSTMGEIIFLFTLFSYSLRQITRKKVFTHAHPLTISYSQL